MQPFGTAERATWLDPVRRANLSESIADRLRSRIVGGELRDGDQLPGHRELAAIYSVSVGSVREALSMLISDGLVETRAGRGTFVVAGRSRRRGRLPAPRLGRKEVEEVIEAREVIEAQLAAFAAERATAEHIHELRRCLDRMRAAASDADAYTQADVEFHLALARAAGNRFLLQAMTDIRGLLEQDMELSAEMAIRRFGGLEFSIDSHRLLVDSIEARDPDAARALLLKTTGRNREFVFGLYALAEPAPSRG